MHSKSSFNLIVTISAYDVAKNIMQIEKGYVST